MAEPIVNNMINDPSEYEDKSKWRTFQEWSNAGWLIIKGSKATKVNGKNLFSREQVKLKPEPDWGMGTSSTPWDENDSFGAGDPNDYWDL